MASRTRQPQGQVPQAQVPLAQVPLAQVPTAQVPLAQVPRPQAPAAPVPQVQAPQAQALRPQAPAAPAPQAQVPQAQALRPQVPAAQALQPQVPQAVQVLPELPLDQDNAPQSNLEVPDPPRPANDGQLAGKFQTLKKELDELKAKTSGVSVEASLGNVRHLATSPTRFRDPHSIIMAIQKLADDARTSHHSRAEEFEAILRQIRPFMYSPQLGDMVTRLVGSTEESKVAATIAKISKSFPAPQVPYHPYPRLGFRGRGRGVNRGGGGKVLRCFFCGQAGHFQRQCPNRR